jgi:hypothetical protein
MMYKSPSKYSISIFVCSSVDISRVPTLPRAWSLGRESRPEANWMTSLVGDFPRDNFLRSSFVTRGVLWKPGALVDSLARLRKALTLKRTGRLRRQQFGG